MDQIPRMCDLLTPAINALLGDLTGARRVARERYAQSGPTGGRFGDLIRGWRGQAELIRARLTKEVMATRLDGCSGEELKGLAKSEYFAELPSFPQFAVGDVQITRAVSNANSTMLGNFSSGTIPAGTRIKRPANPSWPLPALDAEYLTTAAQACTSNDTTNPQQTDVSAWTHIQSFTVPIQATREGVHANIPIFVDFGGNTAVIASKLFDPLFVGGLIYAAGGTLGIVDDQLRALARALATGSNGPTAGAAVAGALTNPGVRHVLYVDDSVSRVGNLYVADESWSISDEYLAQVKTSLKAGPWIGWGCRVDAQGISNTRIAVTQTIMLRDIDSLKAKTDITANVQAALVAYFDERPDFYTWTLDAIGAAVANADSRILACTEVGVYDSSQLLITRVDSLGIVYNSAGAPPPIPTPDIGGRIFHYVLLGVTPTYQSPG